MNRRIYSFGAATQMATVLRVVIVALAMVSCAWCQDRRVWQTRDGKHQIRADLVDANDEFARLKREDGTLVAVPLNRLRGEDVQFVRRWQAERRAKPVPGLIPDRLGEPIDLLSRIVSQEHTLRGAMQRDGTSLVTDAEKRTVIRVPTALPDQYQLRIKTRRMESTTAMSVAIPIAGHQGLVVVDSGYGKKSGLVWIDEKNEPNNTTYYRKGVLANGTESELLLSVYRNHVRLESDGRTVIDWFGDPSRLTLDQRWWSGMPTDQLMIGSYASPYSISVFELRPIEASENDQYRLTGEPPGPSESVALIEHETASGTGFLAATNLLVTNAHVIDGATRDELKVFFPRQSKPRSVEAVLSVDRQRDLAVLSVQSDRPPLPLAQDGHYATGEAVTILGNPSVGGGAVLRNAKVEGTLRSTLRIRNVDLIQVDANINSGSSGGPILNQLGQVVGVTVMKATAEGETMIRQGIRRLDDSIRKSSSDTEDRGIALAVPGQDMVAALERVRQMTFGEAAQSTDMHDARTLYERLVTLAEIRRLESFANVPEPMRRQERVARVNSDAKTASKLVALMPMHVAREVKQLLESEPLIAVIDHCEQDLSEQVNRIANSEFLDPSLRRDLRVMYQRMKELSQLAESPGVDFRRFSTSQVRIQENLERLQERVEDAFE